MTKPAARATLAGAALALLLALMVTYGIGFPLERPGPLAVAALVGAVFGVPLGVLAHRHPRTRR